MSGPESPPKPREYKNPNGKPGYEKIYVHSGESGAAPGVQNSLNTIKSIVNDPAALRGGQPQWKTVDQMHNYLTQKGFHLSAAEAMGPVGKADGQQLIYQGPHNVIVKVKTRGYKDFPPQRVGVATMSIEATDGQGTGWDNALFKVDSKGRIIAKSITSAGEEVVRLPPDHPAIAKAKHEGKIPPEWGVVNPKTKQLRAITKFELLEGGTNPKPIDKQAWADAGHLNLPKDFDPKGADNLAKSAGKNHPTPPPPQKPTPPRPAAPSAIRPHRRPITTRIIGIGKYVGKSAVTALVGVAVGWLQSALGKDDATMIDNQIQMWMDHEVTEELNKHKLLIASNRVAGHKYYANVTVAITTTDFYIPETRSWVHGIPAVSLENVEVSSQAINGAGRKEDVRAGEMKMITTPYTFSFELTLPEEDLAWYRQHRDNYEQLLVQLQNPKLPPDQRRVLEQKKQQMSDELQRWKDQN